MITTCLASLIMVICLISCNQDSERIDQEEQNIAIVRHVHEELAKRNLAVFDEVLAPDYVRHCQAMPPGYEELRGAEPLKAFVSSFYESAPDNKDTIDLIFADEDMVAYVLTMEGTQTGEMGGLPALGKSYSLVNIIIHRFEDGKIAESWVSWDNVSMLTQLGHFPAASDEQP